MIQMSSYWRNFVISQDDMEIVVVATKDAWDILTQLEKNPDTTQTTIEILNEKSIPKCFRSYLTVIS